MRAVLLGLWLALASAGASASVNTAEDIKILDDNKNCLTRAEFIKNVATMRDRGKPKYEVLSDLYDMNTDSPQVFDYLKGLVEFTYKFDKASPGHLADAIYDACMKHRAEDGGVSMQATKK